jgi:hypothetical protein
MCKPLPHLIHATRCRFLALSVTYMVIFIVVGSAIQLKFFLLNNYGIQIIFYFVFLNNQVAWTFLTATIFSKTKTATGTRPGTQNLSS